jgi:hypothetical protein
MNQSHKKPEQLMSQFKETLR